MLSKASRPKIWELKVTTMDSSLGRPRPPTGILNSNKYISSSKRNLISLTPPLLVILRLWDKENMLCWAKPLLLCLIKRARKIVIRNRCWSLKLTTIESDHSHPINLTVSPRRVGRGGSRSFWRTTYSTQLKLLTSGKVTLRRAQTIQIPRSWKEWRLRTRK